jgi:transcriptional regulator with XRE-family HTH domain
MALREARKSAGLSQAEVAKEAGISDSWLRMLEAGVEPSEELKRKLAAALNISVWAIWPDAKVPTDRFRILEARHGQELKIPKSQLPMYKEVVFQMDEDEFEQLIWSGTTPAQALKAIRAFAREHGIEVVMK